MDGDEQVIEIETKQARGKQLTFRIGGELYHFRVPKLYGLVETVKQIRAQRTDGDGAALNDVAMFDKIEEWLFDCLDDAEASDLKARLLDDDDEVDVEHLIEIFQRLTAETSGRPTGRRRSG